MFEQERYNLQYTLYRVMSKRSAQKAEPSFTSHGMTLFWVILKVHGHWHRATSFSGMVGGGVKHWFTDRN